MKLVLYEVAPKRKNRRGKVMIYCLNKEVWCIRPLWISIDSRFMHGHIEPMVTYSMNIIILRSILGFFSIYKLLRWVHQSLLVATSSCIVTTLSVTHLALTTVLYASTEAAHIDHHSVGERCQRSFWMLGLSFIWSSNLFQLKDF